MQLSPFAISPLGLLWTDHKPLPAANYLNNIDQIRFPHAHQMATQSYSHRTPANMIGHATNIWNAAAPTKALTQPSTRHNYSGEKSASIAASLRKRFSRTQGPLNALNEHNGPQSKNPLPIIITNHPHSHY